MWTLENPLLGSTMSVLALILVLVLVLAEMAAILGDERERDVDPFALLRGLGQAEVGVRVGLGGPLMGVDLVVVFGEPLLGAISGFERIGRHFEFKI